MTVRFYFENINVSEKIALENYFQEKKIGRLEKLLQRSQSGHSNFELAKFAVNAKYHRRHDAFTVRLGLSFARNNLRSEEVGHGNLLETFDLALDRIVNQLRKSGGKLHDK